LLCCLSIPDKEQIWRQQRKKKLLESAEAAEKGDKSIAYPLLQSSFLPSFLWLLLFNCRITKPKGKKSATKKSCWCMGLRATNHAAETAIILPNPQTIN
jgi:hypothetical protein